MPRSKPPEPCALCDQPATSSLPVDPPNLSDSRAANVQLCAGHFNRAVFGRIDIGWCQAGAHHGYLGVYCLTHLDEFR